MPLLQAKPGQIHEDHPRCGEEPCLECKAAQHLQPEDWRVVEFYRQARDQVVNLFPMADEPTLVPRLEGWTAVMDLMGIPQVDRAELVQQARSIHGAMEGRLPVSFVHTLPLDGLTPPEAPNG